MRASARSTVWLLMLALGLISAIEASSQPGPPGVSDEAVRKVIELALQNIQRALCEGVDQLCAPATPAEFEKPPVSIEHARAALLTGARTALANWCGLDGQRRSFLAMTRHFRHVLRLNERQISLLALIHGIQQGALAEQLKTKGTCDEATRAKLDAQLPKT